jgi:hypothetical protein
VILRTDRDCDRFAVACKAMLSNGPLVVESRAWKPQRSSQQNRYLHGVVYPTFLAALPGWSRDDVHEYLLGEHFGWEVIEGMGRKRMKPLRRSSRLSKTEFAEYVAFCQQKAAEHGLYVPDPES